MNTIDEKTKKMLREWLATYNGDTEKLARYLRDSIRIKPIRVCREMIAQALEVTE